MTVNHALSFPVVRSPTVRYVENVGSQFLSVRHHSTLSERGRAPKIGKHGCIYLLGMPTIKLCRPDSMSGSCVALPCQAASDACRRPSSKSPPTISSPGNSRSFSVACRSVSNSTSFSLRDIARVRLPRLSTELLAVVSCLASPFTTAPYLSNSVLIAPKSCQTSLDRFCKAKERNPIWNDVNRAARLVGPAMMTR
jgi:hypothetical protein